MRWLARVATRASRREYGRFESWFYESAGAAAVAGVLEPRFRAAVDDAALVLDVGCGGGVLTAHLESGSRRIVGVDPSAPQVLRARRAGLRIARGGAEALPIRTASVDAVVSSCAIKHWVDHERGLAECVRVLRPGGTLAVGEIDADSDRTRLRAFARITRMPRPVHLPYSIMARPILADPSPTADELAGWLRAAGAVDVRQEQLTDLPFVVAWGRRAG